MNHPLTTASPTALYECFDLGMERYHRWGGPPERFARGNGPITDITREEYQAAVLKRREQRERSA